MAHLPHSYEGKYEKAHGACTNNTLIVPPPYEPSQSYKDEQRIRALGTIKILQHLINDGVILYRRKGLHDTPWVISYNASINTYDFNYKPLTRNIKENTSD